MRSSLLLALASLAAFTQPTVQPAFAGNLPSQKDLNQVHWFHYPNEIQVTDERPTVRDLREAPDDGPDYQIEVPPLKSKPRRTVMIKLDGSGNPSRLAIDPSQLPKSGFGRESNIPTRSVAPKDLPNGGLSNHVPVGNSAALVHGNLHPPSPNAHFHASQAPAQAATYSQQYESESASGDSGRKSTSSVKGTFKPGSLLNPPH